MTHLPLSLPIFIPIVCITALIACTLIVWYIKRRLSSHIIHHRVFTLDTIPHVTSCTVIDIKTETETEWRPTMSLAEEMDHADRESTIIKSKERELEEKMKQADALSNQTKERSQHQVDTAHRRELLTDSTLLPPILRPIDRTTDCTGTHRFEFSPDGVLIITPVSSTSTSTSTSISTSATPTPTSPSTDIQHVHPLLQTITPQDTESSSFSMTMSPSHSHQHVTSSGTVTPHEQDITISPLHENITISPLHHHRIMSSFMLDQVQPPQKVIGRSAQISVG